VESAERGEFRGFGVKLWRTTAGNVGVGGEAGRMHVGHRRYRERFVCFVSFGHGFTDAHADVDEERLHMVGYGRF
jgi:hypothetical protein